MTGKWMRGARKVVNVCANIKKGENVLIITDPGINPLVSMSLLTACLERRSEGLVVITPRRTSTNEDPSRRVVDLMFKSDVIICPTSLTMFYTNAKRQACQRGARFLSMTGTTLDVLSSGAIEADFRKQKPIAEKLASRLTAANRISIRTHAGTNVTAELEGRKGIADTGLCEKPGDSTGVPDIEAYIAPIENSVEGLAVVDGSISVLGLVRTPVRLEIHDGTVRRISGGAEARKLSKILSSENDRSVYQIAEIGIGLNPKAKIRGAIVEDESALGTVHLALGDNARFGGRNPAPVHIDMVIRRPVIELDGHVLRFE